MPFEMRYIRMQNVQYRTDCNTLQNACGLSLYFKVSWNAFWDPHATHCNTLQHAATKLWTVIAIQSLLECLLTSACSTLQPSATSAHTSARSLHFRVSKNACWHPRATHCNILQHSAKRMWTVVVLQSLLEYLLRSACNTLQHTATLCNTNAYCHCTSKSLKMSFEIRMQHTATHRCTLQHKCEPSLYFKVS